MQSVTTFSPSPYPAETHEMEALKKGEETNGKTDANSPDHSIHKKAVIAANSGLEKVKRFANWIFGLGSSASAGVAIYGFSEDREVLGGMGVFFGVSFISGWCIIRKLWPQKEWENGVAEMEKQIVKEQKQNSELRTITETLAQKVNKVSKNWMETEDKLKKANEDLAQAEITIKIETTKSAEIQNLILASLKKNNKEIAEQIAALHTQNQEVHTNIEQLDTAVKNYGRITDEEEREAEKLEKTMHATENIEDALEKEISQIIKYYADIKKERELISQERKLISEKTGSLEHVSKQLEETEKKLEEKTKMLETIENQINIAVAQLTQNPDLKALLSDMPHLESMLAKIATNDA